MKRFFKFALVALATAAVAVACQKPEQQPEKIALKGISLNKPAVELAIGAKETLTVKFDPENVTEKPTIEWSTSAPAVATVAEGEVTAVAAGEATITAKAGSFTATCKVTVKGEEQPEPGDFTSPDWANIGAITNGNHTFKFTKDDKYAYFFSERTSEGRFNDIWGGEGYIYFAFDFDNNLETGETLNSNGKYEYIGYIFCFGEKPKVEIVADGDCLPDTYTVKNIIAKGSADDNGVKVEYRVPLADLPQLPENFTIYTWGNKDMAKVIYKYPYEAPAVPKVASWAEAEAAGVIHFFQFRAGANWSPKIYEDLEGDAEDFDNLTVANGVYTVSYEEASNERWQSQFYMRPNPEKATLPLKAGKNYLVSLTFKSNTQFGALAKLTQYGAAAPKHEGDRIKEWESILLEANTEKTVAYVVEGVDCDNVNFVLDFGTHPANTTVEISNVKLEETDLPVGPVGDDTSGPIDINWDYTPSAEYLAESNLWKAVDGDKVGFYYIYDAAGYPAAASDSYELLSFKESTYVLDCKAATESTWANQLFIYPKEGSFIALDPAKTYKVKITVCSNADYYGPFIKLCTYNPETANHEGAEMWALTGWPELITFKAGEPIIKEVELTGKEAQNIIWVMGLGGNPKDAKIYIKDIIVEEVGGDVPPAGLNVDVLDMEFTAVDKTSNSYFDWSDRAGAASTAIYAGQSSTGTGQYIQLRTKNNNSGIITTASGGKLRQVTVAFNSATTDRKINVYAKNTAYTSPTDLYDDTKAGTLLGSIQAGSGNYTIDVTDDYAFVGLRSADGAIYVDKIEIAWEPGGDVPPAPAGIKIDGDFSDWADVPGFESSGNTTKEWKFASDDENIYLYFKIVRSDVIASKTDDPADSGIFPYNWRRYCTFIIDTDNNPATGTDKTYKDLHLTGAEAWGLFYPFRGNANTASGTDGNPSVVNGVDEQGGVETPSTDKVKVYGVVEEDFAYLEAEISRASIGSPASGKMTIQVGLSYNNPDPQEVTLK